MTYYEVHYVTRHGGNRKVNDVFLSQEEAEEAARQLFNAKKVSILKIEEVKSYEPEFCETEDCGNKSVYYVQNTNSTYRNLCQVCASKLLIAEKVVEMRKRQ